jgi:hypothetical protein
MIRALTTSGAAVAIILGAAACGSTASSNPPTSSPTVASPVVAASISAPASPTATAKQSCAASVESWLTLGGGNKYMAAVNSALGEAANTGQGGDVSALNRAASRLEKAGIAALFHLPPACVPGMRRAYKAAMIDFTRSTIQIQIGNFAAATSDIRAGTRADERATAAIHRYGQ